MTNGGQDAGTTTVTATIAADSSYTQLNPNSAAAMSHLGCNGVGGGVGPISRDTSTQVVVLSPASVTEESAAAEGEGSLASLVTFVVQSLQVGQASKGVPEINCYKALTF